MRVIWIIVLACILISCGSDGKEVFTGDLKVEAELRDEYGGMNINRKAKKVEVSKDFIIIETSDKVFVYKTVNVRYLKIDK